MGQQLLLHELSLHLPQLHHAHAAAVGSQLARRMLGLAITDQFIGASGDRHIEALSIFQSLSDPYEQLYYTGLLHQRRVKTQLLVGYAPHTLLPLIEEAMRCFAGAEKIRPVGNDDSILRWNRCVRLLSTHPSLRAAIHAPRESDVTLGD